MIFFSSYYNIVNAFSKCVYDNFIMHQNAGKSKGGLTKVIILLYFPYHKTTAWRAGGRHGMLLPANAVRNGSEQLRDLTRATEKRSELPAAGRKQKYR